MSTSDLLYAAETLTDAGVALAPVPRGAKHPVTAWSERRGVLATDEEIAAWAQSGVMAAITGARVNRPGALVVIDADRLALGMALVEALTVETLCVRSRRGVHLYLIVDAHPASDLSVPGVLDVRCGGCVIIPYSRHPAGVTYEPFTPFVIARVKCITDALPPLRDALIIDHAALGGGSGGGVGRVAPTPATPRHANGKPMPVAHVAQRLDALHAKPSSSDGRFWIGRCPWHNDRHPSLSIDVIAGRVRCFACGARGTLSEALRAAS